MLLQELFISMNALHYQLVPIWTSRDSIKRTDMLTRGINAPPAPITDSNGTVRTFLYPQPTNSLCQLEEFTFGFTTNHPLNSQTYSLPG